MAKAILTITKKFKLQYMKSRIIPIIAVATLSLGTAVPSHAQEAAAPPLVKQLNNRTTS
jgi:hypothetical protein